MRAAGFLALCAFFLLTACENRSPTSGVRVGSAEGAMAAPMRLERVPMWMAGYCRKAANDLGYAVLCPRKLPRLIVHRRVQRARSEGGVVGQVLLRLRPDILFRGPPGYHGPFSSNPSAGHLAIWTIAPTSAMYHGGLFAAPEEDDESGRPTSRATSGTGGLAQRRAAERT